MRRPVIFGVLLFCVIFCAIGTGALAADSGRPGDVDVNSKVNVADAVLLAQYLAEDSNAMLTRQGVSNADVNRDRYINSDDNALLLELIAGLITEDELTGTSETTVSETTTAAETTTTAAETTAAASETTVPAEETKPSGGQSGTVPEAALQIGEILLPLGAPTEDALAEESILSTFGSLTETVTIPYNTCTMEFYIFADDPAQTLILISRNGTVIGYYTTATECKCSNLYTLTEYVDTHPNGTGKLYAVLALSSSASLHVDSIADQSDLSGFARLNFYACNAIRGINGLAPLRWNDALAEIAAAHSRDMAEKNYMDHTETDSDGNLLTPTGRINAAGIKWKRAAENIDGGLRDPFAAANDWYRSEKGHRENLLSELLNDIGIGFDFNPSSYYGIYGTQDFIQSPS